MPDLHVEALEALYQETLEQVREEVLELASKRRPPKKSGALSPEGRNIEAQYSERRLWLASLEALKQEPPLLRDALSKHYDAIRARQSEALSEGYAAITDQQISLFDVFSQFAQQNRAFAAFERGSVTRINLAQDIADKFPDTSLVYFSTNYNDHALERKYADAKKLYLEQCINSLKVKLLIKLINFEGIGITHCDKDTIISHWIKIFNLASAPTVPNEYWELIASQPKSKETLAEMLSLISRICENTLAPDDNSAIRLQQEEALFDQKQQQFLDAYYTTRQILNFIVPTTQQDGEEEINEALYAHHEAKLKDLLLKIIYPFTQAQKRHQQAAKDQISARQETGAGSASSSSGGPPAVVSVASVPALAPDTPPELAPQSIPFINSTDLLNYALLRTVNSHEKELFLVRRADWERYITPRMSAQFRAYLDNTISPEALTGLCAELHHFFGKIYWHDYLGKTERLTPRGLVDILSSSSPATTASSSELPVPPSLQLASSMTLPDIASAATHPSKPKAQKSHERGTDSTHRHGKHRRHHHGHYHKHHKSHRAETSPAARSMLAHPPAEVSSSNIIGYSGKEKAPSPTKPSFVPPLAVGLPKGGEPAQHNTTSEALEVPTVASTATGAYVSKVFNRHTVDTILTESSDSAGESTASQTMGGPKRSSKPIELSSCSSSSATPLYSSSLPANSSLCFSEPAKRSPSVGSLPTLQVIGTTSHQRKSNNAGVPQVYQLHLTDAYGLRQLNIKPQELAEKSTSESLLSPRSMKNIGQIFRSPRSRETSPIYTLSELVNAYHESCVINKEWTDPCDDLALMQLATNIQNYLTHRGCDFLRTPQSAFSMPADAHERMLVLRQLGSELSAYLYRESQAPFLSQMHASQKDTILPLSGSFFSSPASMRAPVETTKELLDAQPPGLVQEGRQPDTTSVVKPPEVPRLMWPPTPTDVGLKGEPDSTAPEDSPPSPDEPNESGKAATNTGTLHLGR